MSDKRGIAGAESLDQKTFIAIFNKERVTAIQWSPPQSTGTYAFLTIRNRVRAFLVTDLTSPARFPSTTFKIERTGSTVVTIPLNGLRGTANQTISPVVPDSTLANYFTLTNMRVVPATQFLRWSRALLTATNTLAIEVWRNFNSVTNPNAATGITVAGNDLLNPGPTGYAISTVSQTVTGEHGDDAGFFGHGHTTVGHPVTDPQHTHTPASLAQTSAAENLTIDWAIFHS